MTEFINFAEGTHKEGELIPDRYEFQLARGTALSGKVIDDKGQPISGVKVDVSVNVDEPAWMGNPEPMISTWLTDDDFNNGAAITDQVGRWSIDNAPAPENEKDFEFHLKFNHGDYLSDFQWAGLQNEQNITAASLRDGTATVVMSRGIQVTGTVNNAAGKPITKGLVVWSDDPYLAEGDNEVAIDETGKFSTPPLPTGKHWLTVLAPGYAPERWEISIFKRMPEIRFTLKTGKRLVIKVVNQQGQPVPNAYVNVGEWQGVNAIYNEKHPNVPESHIPRHADENGVYVWDWAPADAVSYRISAKGHSFTEARLVASDTNAPHRVELPTQLVAHGKVTDARTGAPIEDFSVIPVIMYRPNFFTTVFGDAVVGRNGDYEAPLKGGGEDHYRYRIRVEADGYRTELSDESYGTADGRVSRDFSLTAAVARQGTVIDADGKPIAGAAVLEATPTVFPSVYNAKADMGDRQVETGPDGTFELRATPEPYLVRVMHETAGYAEVVRGPDEPIGTIELQPWAKVSGQLLQNGKPVAKERVLLGPIVNPPLGEPRIQGNYQTLTDGEGRFESNRWRPWQAPFARCWVRGRTRRSPLANRNRSICNRARNAR